MMMTPTLSKTSNQAMSKSAFFLVFVLFVGFPFLGAWFLGVYSLDLEQRFRTEEAIKTLEQAAREVVFKITPQQFFTEECAEFQNRVASLDFRMDGVPAVLKEFLERYPFPFEPYYFNEAGRLISSESLGIQGGKPIESCWRVLQGLATQEDKGREKTIFNLLGGTFDYGRLKQNKGLAIPIFGREGNGLIYWNETPPRPDQPFPASSSGGVMFFMWSAPPPLEILTRVISRLDQRLVLIKRAFDGTCRFARAPADPEDAKLILDLVKKDVSLAQEGDWFSISSRIGDDKLFVARTFPDVRISRYQGHLALLLMVLVMSALLVGWKFLETGERFLSIRWKLMLLFFTSAMFPILGLAVLAKQQVYEKKDVLTGKVLQASQEALSEIDNDFLAERNYWLQFFRSLRDDPLQKTNLAAMKEQSIAYEKQGKVSWFEARDIQGGLLFTSERQDVTQDIGVIATCLAHWCVEKFLQDRMPPGKEAPPAPAQILIQNVLESPMAGWGRITDRPDEIHLVKFGRFDLF